MAEISYRRHRFPPAIIQHAVWLYLRFTLSYRDVEELLAERGLDISYETIRCWVLKFGPVIARRLRRCRPRPSNRWHLDEMVVRIAGISKPVAEGPRFVDSSLEEDGFRAVGAQLAAMSGTPFLTSNGTRYINMVNGPRRLCDDSDDVVDRHSRTLGHRE